MNAGTKQPKTRWITGVGLALGLGLVVDRCATGQCLRYTAQAIEGPWCGNILGYSSLIPWGISENGRICGQTGSCNGDGRAFYWDGSTLTIIPMLPGARDAEALDVNNLGQVVGWTQYPRRGFLYQNGQVVDLGVLPGANISEALSITESQPARIAGYSYSSATGVPYAPFLWQNGIMRALALPLGPYGAGNDMNESNRVVGWMGASVIPPWIGGAFLWENGKVTALGFPAGSTNSEAKAISDNGQICGIHTVLANNSAGFQRRGFYWRNGAMIDIGTHPQFPNIDYSPYDINDAGQVVGDPGFIWQNGTLHLVRDLIVDLPPNIGYVDPYAINNAGQIAATGDTTVPNAHSVALILTPIPPIPGDVTCDWRVDHLDLLQVIFAWGECPAPVPPLDSQCPADFNHDGRVNVQDLLFVINHWSAN